MSRRVFARDSRRTVDLSAQLVAEMLNDAGRGGIFGGRRWASSIRARRGGPGMLQMRTPYARAGFWSSMAHTGPRRAPFTNPAAPLGQKQRVE
jgi:hypothetical protein